MEQTGFFFWLEVISNLCQLESYEMLLKQANNDDLLKYLKHQDTDYLQTIISQNEEIIRLLRGENNG